MAVPWRRKPVRFSVPPSTPHRPSSRTSPPLSGSASRLSEESNSSCLRATRSGKFQALQSDYPRHQRALGAHAASAFTASLRVGRQSTARGAFHHVDYRSRDILWNRDAPTGQASRGPFACRRGDVCAGFSWPRPSFRQRSRPPFCKNCSSSPRIRSAHQPR
jgi:hypothetical protein